MALDPLLVEAVLYFVGAISGLAAVILLGVTFVDFRGLCIWVGNPENFIFISTYDVKPVCDIPFYLLLRGCLVYGTAIGTYHVYTLFTSRQNPVKETVRRWVLQFIMINSIFTVALVIASCNANAGLTSFCNSLMNGINDAGYPNSISCSPGQRFTFVSTKDGTKYDRSTFYTRLYLAQAAAWICFLIWLSQVALCILRFCDNRMHSRGQKHNQAIANVEPTACGIEYITRHVYAADDMP